jgi:hypothetical protein
MQEVRSFEDARMVCGFRQGAIVFRDWCMLGFFTRELVVLSPEDASIDVTMRPDTSAVTI